MKKSISIISSGILAIAMCGILPSCSNDSADISREDMELNVQLNQMLSTFTPVQTKNNSMPSGNGITAKITVDALIYDDSGNLLKELTKDISNYNNQEIVSFTSSVSGSNPTLVVLTYASATDKSGNAYNAYTISGKGSLSTLRVMQEDINVTSIPWQMLGGAIVPLGSSTTRKDIVVKPLGGLVYLEWDNIHSHATDKKAPQRYYHYYKNKDIVTVVDKNFSYSSSLSSGGYYYYQYIEPANNKNYNRVYEIMFTFPTNVEALGLGEYSPSNFKTADDEEIVGKTNTKEISVAQGKQYVFSMDCSDYTIDVRQGIYE